MCSLSHVVALNNDGVSLLLQQNHQGAVGVFLDALRLIKYLLGAQGQKRTSDSQISKDLIHEAAHPIPGFQDPSCFVFAGAITLSPRVINASSSSSTLEDVLNEMTAVILLNMALAYHYAARQSHGSFLINKAQCMYEKAIELVGFKQRRQGTSLLVQVASINNLSHILQTSADYSRSRDGFKYLGSLLTSSGQILRRQMCDQEAYQGMLLNALLATPPNTAAAA